MGRKSGTWIVLFPQALYPDFGDAGASFRDDDAGVAGCGFFEGIGLQGVVDPAGPPLVYGEKLAAATR